MGKPQEIPHFSMPQLSAGGYSSANCRMGFRCVKCKEPHEPGKCSRTSTDTTRPYCVNCDKEDHRANYRGCDYLRFANQTNIQLQQSRRHLRSPNNALPHTPYEPPPMNPPPPPATAQATHAHNDSITMSQLQQILSNFKEDIISTIMSSNNNIQQQINTNSQRIDQLFSLYNS